MVLLRCLVLTTFSSVDYGVSFWCVVYCVVV